MCAFANPSASPILGSAVRGHISNGAWQAQYQAPSTQDYDLSAGGILEVRQFPAYFLPKQPLAPKENGCVASKISLLFRSNHLSGRNSRGDSKFAEDKLAATGFVETMV